MSSWWEITFCATGELSTIDNLENALRSLFHPAVRIASGKNYGGGPAIDAVIGRYPGLTFNGLMVHGQEAQGGGTYFVFTGVGGKAEWRTFILPEVEPDDVS